MYFPMVGGQDSSTVSPCVLKGNLKSWRQAGNAESSATATPALPAKQILLMQLNLIQQVESQE